MAYRYKKNRRTITLGENPGEKFVLTMASEGKIDTEQLCKYIEKNSSISEQDIKILMRALAEVISENVEMGRGVNLEELGLKKTSPSPKATYAIVGMSLPTNCPLRKMLQPAA